LACIAFEFALFCLRIAYSTWSTVNSFTFSTVKATLFTWNGAFFWFAFSIFTLVAGSTFFGFTGAINTVIAVILTWFVRTAFWRIAAFPSDNSLACRAFVIT